MAMRSEDEIKERIGLLEKYRHKAWDESDKVEERHIASLINALRWVLGLEEY